MDEHTKSIHYLRMADHFKVQKALLSQIKDTELREYVEMLNKKFDLVESLALRGFTAEETEELQSLLVRVYDNMKGSEKDNRKEERKR